MSSFFDDVVGKAKSTLDGLKKQYGIDQTINSWPQTEYNAKIGEIYPNYKTKGFLPPTLISPIIQNDQKVIKEKIFDSPLILGSEGYDNDVYDFKTVDGDPIQKKYGEYTYYDWRGQMIKSDKTQLETSDRFNKGILPRKDSDLKNKPYSTIDNYLIFNDNSTNYFKHGLHIIDNLTPIENPENGISNIRLNNFTSTPFEKTDPVFFGFEIVIDDISSPLLNGSILDFINDYSNISEVESRRVIYEEFKQQFVKFFKTKATVRYDEELTKMTKSSIYIESNKNDDIFSSSSKAYMSYYLKKIGGLDKLIEQNTPSIKKYLADYNKDIISLTFSEDVTLSIGTLAHLYKLLYWSKPNGKNIIPENLLRFNCDIIISEVRNFNTVRRSLKEIENGDNRSINTSIQVIKDNLSRYIYSLKECQFYFNSTPHESDIDLSSTYRMYDSFNVQFDYKYSTSKLERFVPDQNGFGSYIGYNNGAMWKVSKSTNRTGGQPISDNIIPVPAFMTVGGNYLNETGVDSPFLLSTPEDSLFKSDIMNEINDTSENSISEFEKLKRKSISKGNELKNKLKNTLISSATRELQSVVNKGTALLNKTLNKLVDLNNVSTRLGPPRNIYTDSAQNAGQRIFYDLRGDLMNFLGSSLGTQIAGSNQTMVVPNKNVTQKIFQQDSRTARELYGTSDFSKIQFPSWSQKYPAPLKTINSANDLVNFKKL